MEDLDKIVRDCAAGDVRAQEKLYRRLAPVMYGVCLRYARDAAEAEDNLQDGFVKVFTHIRDFRFQGSLEGWVRRIMINVSLEKYRKQHLVNSVEDVGIYAGELHANDILEKISAGELTELIQQLPPRYRMVFNLYVMEGMNHQQISEEMGITTGTSKSNLARARELLQKKVKLLYGEKGTKEIYSA